MPELAFQIFAASQHRVWKSLCALSESLAAGEFYLAGGTGLALQLGHRRSVDFDFFSQQSGLGMNVRTWFSNHPGFVLRDADADTVHAELDSTKVSFIGAYRYPRVEPSVNVEGLTLAGVADIGLMKLLAITHRATIRDYIDLAAILRDRVSLETLLQLSIKKYGNRFNRMVPLKALVSFQDLDEEMPAVLDRQLKASWQEILKGAVKEVS